MPPSHQQLSTQSSHTNDTLLLYQMTPSLSGTCHCDASKHEIVKISAAKSNPEVCLALNKDWWSQEGKRRHNLSPEIDNRRQTSRKCGRDRKESCGLMNDYCTIKRVRSMSKRPIVQCPVRNYEDSFPLPYVHWDCRWFEKPFPMFGFIRTDGNSSWLLFDSGLKSKDWSEEWWNSLFVTLEF